MFCKNDKSFVRVASRLDCVVSAQLLHKLLFKPSITSQPRQAQRLMAAHHQQGIKESRHKFDLVTQIKANTHNREELISFNSAQDPKQVEHGMIDTVTSKSSVLASINQIRSMTDESEKSVPDLMNGYHAIVLAGYHRLSLCRLLLLERLQIARQSSRLIFSTYVGK